MSGDLLFRYKNLKSHFKRKLPIVVLDLNYDKENDIIHEISLFFYHNGKTQFFYYNLTNPNNNSFSFDKTLKNTHKNIINELHNRLKKQEHFLVGLNMKRNLKLLKISCENQVRRSIDFGKIPQILSFYKNKEKPKTVSQIFTDFNIKPNCNISNSGNKSKYILDVCLEIL